MHILRPHTLCPIYSLDLEAELTIEMAGNSKRAAKELGMGENNQIPLIYPGMPETLYLYSDLNKPSESPIDKIYELLLSG